jgi:hypothetical protein
MIESEQKWIETNRSACAVLRQLHDMLALSSLPPRRTWVGLTDEERKDLCRSWSSPMDAIYATETKLKEKNT